MGVYLWTDEWLPGSNTVLYMPLNGNVKDEVSGSYGTQGGTVSYETLSSGLKVFHKVSGNYILTPSITMDTEITVVGWIKRTSGDVFFRADTSSSSRTFYQISVGTGGKGGGYYWSNVSGSTLGGGEGGTSANGWFLCVLVCGSNGTKVYSNGELIFDGASTNYIWRTQQWGIGYDQHSGRVVSAEGYFSNLIIEKKQRTAEQVTGYYNQTKSLYGIS